MTVKKPFPEVETELEGGVRGVRCVSCGVPSLGSRPRCPSCGAAVVEECFAPAGHVWSLTTVRVPVPGWDTPLRLAYVDLIDGPRLVGHILPDVQVAVGQRVVATVARRGVLLFAPSDAER